MGAGCRRKPDKDETQHQLNLALLEPGLSLVKLMKMYILINIQYNIQMEIKMDIQMNLYISKHMNMFMNCHITIRLSTILINKI